MTIWCRSIGSSFAGYPQIFTRSETPPAHATLEQRAQLSLEALQQMYIHMALMRTVHALRHIIQPAADQTYEKGDQFLVWRKNLVTKRIGEWVGPSKSTFGTQPRIPSTSAILKLDPADHSAWRKSRGIFCPKPLHIRTSTRL